MTDSEPTTIGEVSCSAVTASRNVEIEVVSDPRRSQVDMVLSWIEEGLERLNRPKGNE